MSNRLSRWGVGPRILLTAGGYASLTGIVTYLGPEVCVIRAVPYQVFLVVGAVLLLVGIPMLIAAGRAAMMAYNSDKLATTGIFGLTRNPIYAAWVVFIIPGLVVLSRSWPLLLTPLVAYVAFKVWIKKENDYLEQRFGDDYRRYRSRVNELIPWAKFMDSREAIAVLRGNLDEYRRLTYSDLQAKVGEDRHFQVVGPSGAEYQVEVQVFWESVPGERLLVVGSVDDGGFRAFMPLCETLVAEPTANRKE